MLGWERTDGLVRGVLDIPGHHFNLMWEENVRLFYHRSSNLRTVANKLSAGCYYPATEAGVQNARIVTDLIKRGRALWYDKRKGKGIDRYYVRSWRPPVVIRVSEKQRISPTHDVSRAV